MAAHLALTVDNFDVMEWRSASLLSLRPAEAQEGANALHGHLLRKADADLTAWERAVKGNDALWLQLGDFAARTPPVVLWRGGGAYKEQFS